jgi:hypothetical protein
VATTPHVNPELRIESHATAKFMAASVFAILCVLAYFWFAARQSAGPDSRHGKHGWRVPPSTIIERRERAILGCCFVFSELLA